MKPTKMTPLRRLLDIRLGGIDQYVQSRRAAHKSWEAIAVDINRQLPDEKPVSASRLRNWYQKETAA